MDNGIPVSRCRECRRGEHRQLERPAVAGFRNHGTVIVVTGSRSHPNFLLALQKMRQWMDLCMNMKGCSREVNSRAKRGGNDDRARPRKDGPANNWRQELLP